VLTPGEGEAPGGRGLVPDFGALERFGSGVDSSSGGGVSPAECVISGIGIGGDV
jgi:hypothetical protein